jgi:hypothetical protein
VLNIIPGRYRPELDRSTACQIGVNSGEQLEALGSVIMPVVLKDANTGGWVKFKFFSFVVTNLKVPMFISLETLKELNVEWDISERGKPNLVLKIEEETFVVESK